MQWTKISVVGSDAGNTIENALHALTGTPVGAAHLVKGFEIRLHIVKGRLPQDDMYEFFASPEASVFLGSASRLPTSLCDKPAPPNGLEVGASWTTIISH